MRVSPELKFRTTDEADTAHVVSGWPAARKPWYIFSPDFVQFATFLAICNASVRHCLFWINAESIYGRRIHYSLSFALFLSKDASKAQIVGHLSMLLLILVMNIFVLWFIFPKLFFQYFFPKIFFRLFQIFFWGLYSRCLCVYRDKTWSMYLCYEKYNIQQAVEIGLSSRVMCKVLFFGSYCSHHTRRENFNFFPAPHNILLYNIFSGICDI